MKCKNCGKEILNNSKFCPYCGEDIIKDDKSNKKILIIGMVVILIVAIVIGVFIYSNSSPAYEDFLKTAEKYMDEEKYEEAIDYYTKCLEINPKMEEPYEKLYEIYLNLGKEDLANEIVEKAKENLSSASLKLFLKNKDNLDSENELYKKAEKQESIEISYEMKTYFNQDKYIYFVAPSFNGNSLLAQNANKVFSSYFDDYLTEYKRIDSGFSSYYNDVEETYRSDKIISFRCITNVLLPESRPYSEYECFTFDIFTGQLLETQDLVDSGDTLLNEYIYTLLSDRGIEQESEQTLKRNISFAIDDDDCYIADDGFHIYIYNMGMQYNDICIPFINIKLNYKYFM